MESEKTVLGKGYEPGPIEDKWYMKWVEEGLFKADPASPKPKYSIVIPPPNITGSACHALDNTLQDILCRSKRCRASVLWLPGTDHAGIATQNVSTFSRQEGISRHDLGREVRIQGVGVEKRVREHDNPSAQKLGASCDWDRERFTMDEGLLSLSGRSLSIFK